MRLEFESNISTLPLSENGHAETTSEKSSAQVKELLKEGIKAAQAGNRASARHLLLRVTEIEPQNENAWLWLSSISEYPEELLIFLNNVLEVNPQNERALEWMKATKSLLAKTFVQRGIDASKDSQPVFAKQCFYQAAAHDDQNEMAWLWLASMCEYVEEKKSYLDKVLNINPSNEAAQTAMKSVQKELAQILLEKAEIAAVEGNTESAKEMLAEVFQKTSDLEDAWLLKAHLSNSFDEKIKCFEKTLELNPDNLKAQTGLDSFRAIMNISLPKYESKAVVPFAEDITETQPITEEIESPEFDQTTQAQFTDEYSEAQYSEDISEPSATENHPEAIHSAEDFIHDNNPTQDLVFPEAASEVYNFVEEEKETVVENSIETDEQIDQFFDSFQHQNEEEKIDFSAPETVDSEVENAQEKIETSSSLFEEFVEEVSFEKPSVTFDNVETTETVQERTFDDVIEEMESAEETQYQIPAELAEEIEEVFQQEAVAETSFEQMPTVAYSAEETAQAGAFSHEEEIHITQMPHSFTETEATESIFEEEIHITQPEAEFHTESIEEIASAKEVAEVAQQEEVHPEFAYQTESFAPEASETEQHFAVEETTNSHVETVAETFERIEETKFEPVAEFIEETKPHAEMMDCPFCNAENEAQTFACNSCRAVLSISDLERLIANQEADKKPLQSAVSRMELEKNLRGFDANELMFLGIGHINLKNLRQGYTYLHQASQMNPDHILLKSQVNALALRLEEIEKQEEIHDSQPKGRTILVVDDSPTVRKLISGKLEKSGHEVVCAVDGMDALAKLNEIVPDLILLDITMPRMDGYQVCKLIRNNTATKDIPVVMISGKDGFFDKVRGRMAGTTGYITKPFGPETLMKALDVYIKPAYESV